MEDPILLFSGYVFLSLFAMLGLIFLVSLGAYFKKREWEEDYEPSVSVIIPAYNEEKNIRNCLEAVYSSDYPGNKLEVIVVDDGSSDRTVEVAGRFKGTRILKQEHVGKVDALNLGFEKSSGDVVITLDADVMVEKDFIKNTVKPFSDEKVGAVCGAAKVSNGKGILSSFQAIEYVYNSYVMDSFSTLFGTSFWFWGALASFRKSVVEKVGGFSKNTETEDFDIILQIKRAGYKTLSMRNAVGRTFVPPDIRSLFRQRVRWAKGSLQTVTRNKDMFSPKYGMVTMFLIFTQFFWLVYSFLAIPLIAYQILYWIPYNSATIFDLSFYLFRWFNLLGPFYALYMIPEWGISITSIFGVLSGVITVMMMALAFRVFREKMEIRKYIGVFFYFPYTILINLMMITGTLRYILNKGRGSFIK